LKFTLTSLPAADDDLMRIFMDSSDGDSITHASHWIDKQLENDPLKKVTPVDDHYFLRCGPLLALCRISVDDRLVTIVEFRSTEEI